MIRRIAIPLAAAVIALLGPVLAHAAPEVAVTRVDYKYVLQDTLGRAATDTVFTDSVEVQGARIIYLVATSRQQTVTYQSVTLNGDSLTVPIVQTKLPGGQWTYAGGGTKAPGMDTTTLFPSGFASTTLVDRNGVVCYTATFQHVTIGTQAPSIVQWIRWRVRSSNGRPQPAPTNTYDLRAVVVRY